MNAKIYIILLFAFTVCSCNDWLDIQPKGQVEAKELLKNEKGYNSALGGVYYILSDTTMYGKELSYGTMDLLAQYWDLSGSLNHNYYQLSQYNYEDPQFAKPLIKKIWKGFYEAIAQCNLIIESLDENRNSIKYAELIEGEAYGLRAFAHMELFKIFGPVIESQADLDKKSIAYRRSFDNIVKEFEPGKDVLNKVKEDLLTALDFLKEDPIITSGRKADGNSSVLDYHEIINRRGSRLNYYAVLGLLARVEQLLLNQDQAYFYAKRIIDENEQTNAIRLIDKSNIESPGSSFRDLNYSMEMLFSFYVNNLYEKTDYNYYLNGKNANNYSFTINNNLYNVFVNELYGRIPDGSGTDNRLRYWLEAHSSISNIYVLTKLTKAAEISGITNAYDPEIPIIRMSEIYYIACESQIGKNNSLALSYLNKVRETRNLLPLTGDLTNEEIKDFLLREARKDFIGEGRMFLMYKRLFSSFYVKQGVIISPSESLFVIPIPDEEYEFSTNQK